MDAVSLAGVLRWHNMGCGFFSLLLRSKSGASWSAPLVHPLTQWLGAAAGADCAWLQVRPGGFWNDFLFYVPFAALFAPGNLDFAFALVSFSPSCLGVASGVRRIRDACYAWFNSGYMFYERLLANFTYFLRVVHSDPWRSSPFRRMEKCAQLMLRVAVFLRAVRTLNLDIFSTSSPRDGVGLTHFSSFFALLRVVPELSASFSSPRW